MAKLPPFGPFRAFDGDGKPLAGGRLYTYEARTVTPKATYTDSLEETENTNPIILDDEGYASVWLGAGAYKLVLHDENDVPVWPVPMDDVAGTSEAAFGSQVVSLDTNIVVTDSYKNAAIIATDVISLSLIPAASAGSGFYFIVKNSSDGEILIVPDGSDAIDQDTLNQNESALIICDGEKWFSFFLYRIPSAEDIPYDNSNSNLESENVNDAIDELAQSFFGKAIGEVFFCSDNISGAETPDNSGERKFVRLTAGQSGTGGFNNGLLTNETTTGSGATLVITAEISSGPMTGGVIHLINSMDAVIKASVTSDVFEQDAFQGHWHTTWGTPIDVISGSQPVARGTNNAINQDVAGYSAARAPKSDGENGTPRVADRTRVKSVSKVAYMRVV